MDWEGEVWEKVYSIEDWHWLGQLWWLTACVFFFLVYSIWLLAAIDVCCHKAWLFIMLHFLSYFDDTLSALLASRTHSLSCSFRAIIFVCHPLEVQWLVVTLSSMLLYIHSTMLLISDHGYYLIFNPTVTLGKMLPATFVVTLYTSCQKYTALQFLATCCL